MDRYDCKCHYCHILFYERYLLGKNDQHHWCHYDGHLWYCDRGYECVYPKWYVGTCSYLLFSTIYCTKETKKQRKNTEKYYTARVKECMKKIICICTENICRSPMLEVILRKKLKDNAITNIKVDSAGVYVKEGLTISPNSKKVINEHGLRIGKRKAKQIKSNMVDHNTLLLTVTDTHKHILKNVDKVISLNDFEHGCNILDPYGQDIEVYRKCYEQMDYIADEIVQYIKEGKLRW